MSTHPLNLALRFMLELANLIAVGYWGFAKFEGFYGYIVGIGAPIALATIWGVFAVRNDPSRSGKTVVNTPRIIRLFLELVFFLSGCYVLFNLKQYYLFGAFSTALVVHYLFSINRIKWLLS